MRTLERSLLIGFVASLAAGACDTLPPTADMSPSPISIRVDRADSNFRLTPAERRSIQPTFDADALERLLARIRPEKRPEILLYFQIERPRGLGHLTAFTEPDLQRFLEEVWAPLWDTATDQEIEANIYGLPGRGVARERRARGRRPVDDPRGTSKP